MNLFLELIRLKEGRVEDYQTALDIFIRWFHAFPLQNNRWGPFFEEVPGRSDTQINKVAAQVIVAAMKGASAHPKRLLLR